MADDFDSLVGRVPYKAQMPTAQQAAMALAVLSLTGPMGLGGMPVIPVTAYDDRRRHQEQITQQSESTVGIYQTSSEAEVALSMSQQRLAHVTREIDGLQTPDVREKDVVHAANRVFAGDVDPKLSRRFRSALGNVATDTVDLFILRDNESATS